MIKVCAFLIGTMIPLSMMAQTEDNNDAAAIEAVDSVQNSHANQYDVELAKIELQKMKAEQEYYLKTNGSANSVNMLMGFMDTLDEILVPICICVVLPIVVLLIVFYNKRKKETARMAIIDKLIDKGEDVSEFIAAEKKVDETPRRRGSKLLIWGLILTIGGLLFCVCVFMVDFRDSFETDSIVAGYMCGLIPAGIGAAMLLASHILHKWDKQAKNE